MSVTVNIPVSVGELIDKFTILSLKKERITDVAKRINICAELELLEACLAMLPEDQSRLILQQELYNINDKLWDIEDAIRDCERRKDFGAEFIALARGVYLTNDQRSRVKHAINLLANSTVIEEKSYAQY